MVYFNSSSVAGDVSCVQLEIVNDNIVEDDEVLTFRAVARNALGVFYEDNSAISLILYDDDGMCTFMYILNL